MYHVLHMFTRADLCLGVIMTNPLCLVINTTLCISQHFYLPHRGYQIKKRISKLQAVKLNRKTERTEHFADQEQRMAPRWNQVGVAPEVTWGWAGPCGSLHTWVGPSFLRT